MLSCTFFTELSNDCITVFILCTGKFLLMLQSLKRSMQLDPDNSELHTNLVDFLLACE